MSDDMISKEQVEEFDWGHEDDDGFDPDFEGEDYGSYEPPEDQFRDDVEADADTLASAGYGTDEDYGYFGGDYE